MTDKITIKIPDATKDTMNLASQRKLINDMVKQKAVLLDSATHAFVEKQFDAVLAAGLDPTEYEVIFASDEYPKFTEDGLKIIQRIRLVKKDSISNLSAIGESEE